MTDIEYANKYKMKNIKYIAKKIGLSSNDIELYGDFKAKIKLKHKKNKNGKLILVTSINPTKYGEGKTTVSIGLADALNSMNHLTCLALREPSLGPVFGLKGGATGGGKSQIVPMTDINLHFTGDFNAISTANNFICSMIDNNFYFGNPLNLNPDKINFHRCLDLNDRALRDIDLHIKSDMLIKEKFNITAASEIMSIMTLSSSLQELKERISNILIGFNYDNLPVFVRDLNCVDAVAIILKDCLNPNLVQTLNGTPAIVHLGPFANISHGCNSVVATKTALDVADFAITEAGFGSDLGAEKFFDLICQTNKLQPYKVVLVVTLRAIKINGAVKEDKIFEKDKKAIDLGLNLVMKHYKNLTNIFNQNVIVAINIFPNDSKDEIDYLLQKFESLNVKVVVCNPYKKGGKGCLELAQKIVEDTDKKQLKFAYNLNDDIKVKIEKIAKSVYGAREVFYSEIAEEKYNSVKKCNLNNLPVIIAKTQYSLSDNQLNVGATCNFDFTITDFEINSGAGYIVAIAGKMLLMPGLNSSPNAIRMTIDNNGNISGII